jgi:hypothetical protein
VTSLQVLYAESTESRDADGKPEFNLANKGQIKLNRRKCSHILTDALGELNIISMVFD